MHKKTPGLKINVKTAYRARLPGSLNTIIAAGVIPVVIFVLSISLACASEINAQHRLRVELFPDKQQLLVHDQITFGKNPERSLTFKLAPHAKQLKVTQNGAPVRYNFKAGQLRVDLPPGSPNPGTHITIGYTTVFDDPAPVRPVNADNPGYGVSATISERGSFLLAGSGWYPRWADGHSTYKLKVVAPKGMLAVTAGKLEGHQTQSGKSVSNWLIKDPIRGLSLSVGPYIIRQKKVGNITAATYFFAETDHLAAAYLEATARYLTLYQELFGPYPFEKFAVVENFFPTGYGFPSYTLIGGSVLRLPFIIHTSLGHEIAHCWWGNGVLVDYETGNWSEALTTYVADYLYKEMKSDTDARTYRQQILRNYATLVKPDQDFALHRFQSRYNPTTKTIGYDKGAMVFHMLRRQMGDDAFWGALKDLYRERLHKRTSWSDMQTVFESRAKRSLADFFDQWVLRKGAPQFQLDTVRSRQTGETWTIEGRIVQHKPEFSFELDLALESHDQTISQTIRVADKETRFQMISPSMPLKLQADPDTNIFRKLVPDEIPPAINSLKSSRSLLVLLPDHLEPDIKSATRMLLRSLGIKQFRLVHESTLDPKDLHHNDILLVGYPSRKELLVKLPGQVDIKATSFTLNQVTYDRATDIFFGVFAHPYRKDRVTAMFLPLSASHVEEVARKVTHYGKYSYLAFQGGTNRDKGFWSTEQSPLEYRWRRDGSATSHTFRRHRAVSVF
ncbi:MAG: M1 family peptidase [Deltaproteobacteria bacterium]|nr:M1 family peptidase [Deltaproteobacteria bacterium]